ncbi:TY5A, partial [Symbiodinium sp. CCMP2456]
MAQSSATAVPNGVGTRNDLAPERAADVSYGSIPKSGNVQTTDGQEPEVGPSGVALLDLPVQSEEQSPQVVETASAQAQAEPNERVLTMPDAGGRSSLGRSDSVATPDGYVTPKSSMGSRVGQPAWLSGVDVPKKQSNAKPAAGGFLLPVEISSSHKSDSTCSATQYRVRILAHYLTVRSRQYRRVYMNLLHYHLFIFVVVMGMIKIIKDVGCKAEKYNTSTKSWAKGSTMLAPLPEGAPAMDAAITFQDWVEISGSVMSDLSEGSASWWQGVLGAVESTYSRWLAASPLEKLSIEPQGCVRTFNQEALQNDKKYSSSCRRASSMASLDGALQNHADDSDGLSEALAGGDRGHAYGQDWEESSCADILLSHRGASEETSAPNYSHSMAGMDKEVGRAQPKGTRDAPHKPPAAATEQSAQSTMATVGASSTSPSSAGDTIPGTPWTLETLIQAAQQIVHPTATDGQASDTSPEKTRPQLKVLKLRDIRICSADSSATALVDSGATHSLRSAASQEEWDKSSEVMVQLAGNYKLVMRISDVGTLLMPYRDVQVNQQHLPGPQAQTIVPMGQLIETLGYTMMWSPKECYLQSPEGVRIPLQVDGGCPQLAEMEALALIARLEDRKVEELHNSVLTTQDKLKVSAVAMEHTWEYYLFDYVAKGAFESGLRAVRDAPFFADLPGECLSGMIPTSGLWSGWDTMKNLGYMNRAQKRKLLTSKRWIVHLFAGKEGHYEMFKLDQGDTAVIELDIERCQGHDLFRAETWRMLLWGAKEGKIDAIFGGPPGRALQKGKGGRRDNKSTALVARMMWLYSMAQVGREVNGTPSAKSREVGFMIEYPEGISPEIRGAEAARINEYEDATRVTEGRGGVAGWYETIHYWEAVQRPRLDRELGAMGGRIRRYIKGNLGKNLKYLLVGKYLVPKQYIEDYSGQPTPSVAEVPEHDLLPPLTDEQKKDMEELFGESESGTELPLECPQVEVVGVEATHLQYGPEDEEMGSYEPSEAADEEVGPEEELEASRDAVMKDGDCEAPEMTHLVFATALPNNQ